MFKRISLFTKNDIVNNLFIIAFLLIIFLAPFFCLDAEKTNFLCNFSFVLNGLIFIIGILLSQRKYTISIGLIYWIFMFFFMYFSPLVQYRLNHFPWLGSLTENDILLANVIILIFNLFFVLGVMFEKTIKLTGVKVFDITKELSAGFEIKKSYRIILTGIVILLAAYSLSKTGFSGIIVSRMETSKVFYSGDNSATQLLVESFVAAFMTYITFDAAQNWTNKKENGIRFILLFLCLLICFFPTTIPRYKAATIYGVIFLILFPALNKSKRFFWFFTIGLFVIFPFLDSFRRVISMETVLQTINTSFFESYTDGDYDAYRMLVSAMRYVKNNGAVMGNQLLGVILFFIPSDIWKSKPIGSGALLIKNELGAEAFSNVSCPFIGEGLINFGIIGVVIFALFLGVFITKIDIKYWKNYNENNNQSLFSTYLILLFMMFFVLRGDLLSSFAYVCGFVITGLILRVFAKRI